MWSASESVATSPGASPADEPLGYVRGLLSGTERKNGWQLAEHLGDPTPDGVEHLLARADGDADAVRDDLLGYVAQHLGHPDGVLVVDETGFLKKGTKSCGVARQYSGTAGRIENCQVGVFLGYATTKGRALLDRALYLPKDWAGDADRRQDAGVPEGVGFATKIVQARQMIDRAVAAGVRSWTGWHRHVTLSLFALAVVAVIRSRVAKPVEKGRDADRPDGPGGAPAVPAAGMGLCNRGRARSGVVAVAARVPAPSEALLLPHTRRATAELTTAVGLRTCARWCQISRGESRGGAKLVAA